MTEPASPELLPESRQILLRLASPSAGPIPAILTDPKRGTDRAVILCHGFLSDKNSRTNQRLTELLIPRELATLRFDWYGMGELKEHFFYITLQHCLEQLETVISFLRTKGYHSLGLIGSSFGGLMAILCAATLNGINALGLKCPVADFPECLRLEFGPEAMRRWQQEDRIPNILGGEERIPLRYDFYEECLRYDVYALAGHIQIPTRIVHGAKDTLIPCQQIDKLTAALKGLKDLRILPEADHQFGRPEDFRVMTALLANWMVDHLPSSGTSGSPADRAREDGRPAGGGVETC